MRFIPAILFILPFLASCNSASTADGENTPEEASPAVDTFAQKPPSEPEFYPNSPFNELPLRYNGYYREEIGDLRYLLRFYPEGRVVLVNGMKDVEDQLPPMLGRDALGDPNMGYYNVMVTVKGDSMFFSTQAVKGELSYRGIATDGSRVVLLRHSHINGVRSVKEYHFVPDEPASE